MRTVLLPLAPLVVGVTAALTACAGGPGAAADDPGRPTVVTSSYPLQFAAAAVAGDRAEVVNLTPPGADSHGLDLTPQQIGGLGAADLVVHLSGMQPAVDEALAVAPPARLVDAAPLADLPGDPHFWLDPGRLAALGRQVAAELADLDPGDAAGYTAAADRLAADLAALDAEQERALAPCRGATLVTSHEAFGYLAREHGLEQVGIAGVDPHVEPSPARVRDVVDVVRGRDVRTVFFEATTSPAVARTLAADLGVGTAVLHPVERVEEGQDYPTLVRENLSALVAGLAC